jgi:hypothetical protein
MSNDSQIVDNNVGVQVEGQYDVYENPVGPGAEQVSLGTNTVVACNGSAKVVQPAGWISGMYSYVPPGNQTPLNSGADIWDQNTSITVDAQGLSWTRYSNGVTQVATCDPTCFTQPPGDCNCSCTGPSCPFKKTDAGIPDGLIVVQYPGAAVNAAGGAVLYPEFCVDAASAGL